MTTLNQIIDRTRGPSGMAATAQPIQPMPQSQRISGTTRHAGASRRYSECPDVMTPLPMNSSRCRAQRRYARPTVLPAWMRPPTSMRTFGLGEQPSTGSAGAACSCAVLLPGRSLRSTATQPKQTAPPPANARAVQTSCRPSSNSDLALRGRTPSSRSHKHLARLTNDRARVDANPDRVLSTRNNRGHRPSDHSRSAKQSANSAKKSKTIGSRHHDTWPASQSVRCHTPLGK